MEGKGLSKRDKRIERWRNNPRDVDFEELRCVMEYFGCYVDQPRSGSSHYVIGHEAVSRSITVVKSHPLKPVYVKRALALIDEIKEAIADGDI